MPIRDLTRKLKKTLSKKNRTHKRSQRGAGCGCGSRQYGGRVVKPAEYYGGDSKRYHAIAPAPEDHAYGKTNAVSFGSIAADMQSTGPNLAPYPNSSGMMTGGAKRRGSKSKGKKGMRKRSNKSKSKGKKSMRKRSNRRSRK